MTTFTNCEGCCITTCADGTLLRVVLSAGPQSTQTEWQPVRDGFVRFTNESGDLYQSLPPLPTEDPDAQIVLTVESKGLLHAKPVASKKCGRSLLREALAWHVLDLAAGSAPWLDASPPAEPPRIRLGVASFIEPLRVPDIARYELSATFAALRGFTTSAEDVVVRIELAGASRSIVIDKTQIGTLEVMVVYLPRREALALAPNIHVTILDIAPASLLRAAGALLGLVRSERVLAHAFAATREGIFDHGWLDFYGDASTAAAALAGDGAQSTSVGQMQCSFDLRVVHSPAFDD